MLCKHLSILFYVITCFSFSLTANAVEDCDKGVILSNGNTLQNLSGVVTCRDRDTNKLTRQIAYKDGQQNGEEIRYDADTEKKHSSTFYVNGERHGPYIEYDPKTGKIIEQSTFVHGGQEGVEKHFFPDGKIKSIAYYAHDGSSNTRLEYDENGKLSDIQCGPHSAGSEDITLCGRNNQMGIAIVYRGNGQPAFKRQYLNGELHGLNEIYGDKGQILSQEYWKVGKRDGVWKIFRRDGTLARQETYIANVRDGEQIEFFADGKAKKTSQVLHDHKKIAETTWYQNGQVASKEERQGKLWEIHEYYDNGQISREATWDPALNNGAYYNAWVGLEKQYYENGKPKAEIHYTDKAQKQGNAEYYHSNGQLAVQETWENNILQQRVTFDEKGKKLSDEAYYPDGSRKY